MNKMKKSVMIFALMILLINVSAFAVLEISDYQRIEEITKNTVREENKQLRQDLNKDVMEVKKEVDNVVNDIQTSATKDRVVLVLTLASVVIISQTAMSLLSFVVWRKKRKLEMLRPSKGTTAKEEKKEVQSPEKKGFFQKKDKGAEKDNTLKENILKKKNDEISLLKKQFKEFKKDTDKTIKSYNKQIESAKWLVKKYKRRLGEQ